MATALSSRELLLQDSQYWTLADVLERVPDLPSHRICLQPLPGTATEVDARRSREMLGVTCELINGTLVRKAMGAYESILAIEMAVLLAAFIKPQKLGRIVGADGPMRARPGQVRFPDVAFYSWERLKGHFPKRGSIMQVGPDLAIEILSPDNTKAEMDEKLQDYFKAKVRLVWYIDPQTKTARVYTSPKKVKNVTAKGSLDGGDVLPGFKLNLAEFFASVEPPE